LALNRDLGDEEGIASSLANLCGVAMLGQRDDIPALAALEEAKALRPKITNRRTVGNLLILEGRVALARGDLERAVELGEESLEIYRAARDAYGIVMCLLHISFVMLAQNDYERTAPLLREGLQLSRELEHKVFIQYCVTGLAGVAASKGFPVRAARLWGGWRTIERDFRWAHRARRKIHDRLRANPNRRTLATGRGGMDRRVARRAINEP